MNTRTAIAAGTVGAVLLGGGVAVAATAQGGPHGNGPQGGQGGQGGQPGSGRGPGGGPNRGPGGGQPGGPQSLGGGPGFQHGSYVSGSTSKGFTTYDVQDGTVTEYKAGSSITVRSADGFSAAYVITSATKIDFSHKGGPKRGAKPTSSASPSPSASASAAPTTTKAIAVGDTVGVTAKVVSGAADATHISDQGVKPVATATATPSN